jgi:hypothetical protein
MGLTKFGVCKPQTSSNPMFGASTTFFEPIRIGCRIDAQHRADRIQLIVFIGGADRDRTGGLLVANQALSQLSYSPNPAFSS